MWRIGLGEGCGVCAAASSTPAAPAHTAPRPHTPALLRPPYVLENCCMGCNARPPPTPPHAPPRSTAHVACSPPPPRLPHPILQSRVFWHRVENCFKGSMHQLPAPRPPPTPPTPAPPPPAPHPTPPPPHTPPPPQSSTSRVLRPPPYRVRTLFSQTRRPRPHRHPPPPQPSTSRVLRPHRIRLHASLLLRTCCRVGGIGGSQIGQRSTPLLVAR